jgi:hypothetical protein
MKRALPLILLFVRGQIGPAESAGEEIIGAVNQVADRSIV